MCSRRFHGRFIVFIIQVRNDVEVSRTSIIGVSDYKPEDAPIDVGMKNGDIIYLRSEALDGQRACTMGDMGVSDDDELLCIPLAVKVSVKVLFENVSHRHYNLTIRKRQI